MSDIQGSGDAQTDPAGAALRARPKTCPNVKIEQVDPVRNLWDVTYTCGAVERVDMRASNHAIPENDRKHRCAAEPTQAAPVARPLGADEIKHIVKVALERNLIDGKAWRWLMDRIETHCAYSTQEAVTAIGVRYAAYLLRCWSDQGVWPCPDEADCDHQSDLQCLAAALAKQAGASGTAGDERV